MLKAMDAGACNVKSPDNEMYQFYTPKHGDDGDAVHHWWVRRKVKVKSGQSMSYNQPYCYTYAEPFPYDPTAPSAYCALPYSAQQFAFAPHGTFPGSFYGAPYPMTTPIGDIGNRTGGDEIPNFQAVASAAPNGSDLPLHDLVTLRYFYNLGVEYFRNNQFRLEPPAVVPPTRNTADVSSAMDDGNEIRDLANEFKHGMNFSAPNAKH
ncbi:hypothetical protein pipiens_011468 [Culex pipiens pipiens]|uniref:Uncharacterized protein n=1 Tax=Culex pipiens pipiens TaxID=38569 RepID=A0ABD1D6B9_CULPP